MTTMATMIVCVSVRDIYSAWEQKNDDDDGNKCRMSVLVVGQLSKKKKRGDTCLTGPWVFFFPLHSRQHIRMTTNTEPTTATSTIATGTTTAAAAAGTSKRFSDYFWDEEDEGFATLMERMKAAKHTCTELAEIFKTRYGRWAVVVIR